MKKVETGRVEFCQYLLGIEILLTPKWTSIIETFFLEIYLKFLLSKHFNTIDEF